MTRLNELPDWGYLLREMYELYRFLPSGGSLPIRAHQRRVREDINKLLKANADLRPIEAAAKPVTAHLRRALDEGLSSPNVRMVRALEAVCGTLSWQYGYDKIPRGLERSFAFAEIVAPGGPVISETVILGLVLFAPGCTYPAHAHDGITESYITLSGAVSENNQGVYAPGSLIFNPPGHRHRITVSDREPSLLLYAWTGPSEKLANQKMIFSRGPRKTGGGAAG
ncbi:dimethylsulfonioproprionate lyase family protein [Salinihabitans flavidus]|uniref:dimethylsulfonioproprionate lyase family protein n=1 Tax=Salinihabitans flavidus TaxID=569882 RepID=UPI003CCBF5A8